MFDRSERVFLSGKKRIVQYELASESGKQWTDASFVAPKITTPWKKKRMDVLIKQYEESKGKSSSSNVEFPEDVVKEATRRSTAAMETEDTVEGVDEDFKGVGKRPAGRTGAYYMVGMSAEVLFAIAEAVTKGIRDAQIPPAPVVTAKRKLETLVDQAAEVDADAEDQDQDDESSVRSAKRVKKEGPVLETPTPKPEWLFHLE